MNVSPKVIKITSHPTRFVQFLNQFKDLKQAIEDDFQAIAQKDPAAGRWQEIITCYPGFHALIIYRIAHRLYHLRLIWFARFLSYLGRWWTGIDIHPAAQLGRGILIDHGMGVVIGETAIVGDGVTLYQGVTLGELEKKWGNVIPLSGIT